MAATPDYYESILEALPTTEGGVLVVRGARRAEVADVLGVDLTRPLEGTGESDEDQAEWAIVDIADGVLAFEFTGYGDPSLDALARLSSAGRAAAVVRDNVQGHCRFGYAHDGVVLFDADEFTFIEDPKVVPPQLRPLFDLVWNDMDADEEPDFSINTYAVGLAMAELVTGIELTDADLARLDEAEFLSAPAMLYLR